MMTKFLKRNFRINKKIPSLLKLKQKFVHLQCNQRKSSCRRANSFKIFIRCLFINKKIALNAHLLIHTLR